MRILLAHNFYQSSAPSGEDNVFKNELKMLENSDHYVYTFTKHNDVLNQLSFTGKVSQALQAAWSDITYKQLTETIHKIKPDIVHFHNTFPQISPSAYAACNDNNVAVIQTLHNYRLICSGAMLYRNGQPCEDCIPGKLYPGIVHKCYRGSRFATIAVANMLYKNWKNGVYSNLVNQYIALSKFALNRFIAGGLPANKLTVKPNFLPDPPDAGPGGDTAIFVGRLSREKGVHTLLAAWKSIKNQKLIIIGDGPLRAELEQIVREQQMNVDFAGFCTHEQIYEYISSALFQIIPSETYEGFPMVVLEAYACGTPVVASRLGSLDELIHDKSTGLKFNPGDSDDLARILKDIYSKPEIMSTMRSTVRNIFDSRYTEESNINMLNNIYEASIDENSRSNYV